MTSSNLIKTKSRPTAAVTVYAISDCLNLPSLNPRRASAAACDEDALSATDPDEAFEVFGDKSEHAVAAPQYRAVANTAMGWKNANLLTELRIEN